MEKKRYIIPVVESLMVNTILMQKTGEASLLPGPGTGSGAPMKRGDIIP